jgi:hypothetical protein
MSNANNTTKKISKSEKTNAKNQENTHIVNTIIASLGELYKPTNPLIEKAAMLAFEETFNGMSQAVITAVTNEQNTVDAQIAAFKTVSKRVSLIMKAVRSQDLEDEFVAHLQSNVYRLNGVRIDKNTPDVAPETEDVGETGEGGTGTGVINPPRTYSVSRRSYAGILESLRFFNEQLKLNPGYKPNEDAYKSTTIEAWVESLGGLHDAALEAKVATRAVRHTRNAYVYHETDGLLARINAVKNYLGYILSPADPRLKQLKTLQFVDNTR